MKECLRITEIMLDDKCASMFSRPVDPVKDGIPEYFNIIKNPQDLGTIKERLLKNYYQIPAEWENDMNTVWMNALKFNGPESIIGDISNNLKAKFTKLCAPLHMSDPVRWISRCQRLFFKLDDLLQTSPATVRKLWTGKKFITTPEGQKKLMDLAEASSSLNSDTDHGNLLQIVNRFNVDIEPHNTEMYINMTDMPQIAIIALKKYVKERYKELHIQYPKQ